MFKGSRLQMFFKILFANFTEIHPRWSLFLIKLQALRTVTLLKRDSNTGFSCEIYEFFKNIFFYSAPPVAASVCL